MEEHKSDFRFRREREKSNIIYFPLMQWTWVWISSESWWWTGKPGVLQLMGSQRVGHDWVTERLNWTELNIPLFIWPTTWESSIDMDTLCVSAKSLQSYLTLCDSVDCSLPGSSVHGILQARILEWVAIPSFRDQTSYLLSFGRWVLYR